ncbi:hypothetical protein Sa4125_40640 [Aureimonas sp. SA4125]|uniref:UPF0280 family protein n=1 Tax=Aureimonas sp. SA4125 TaxID=2826993 RepID=UPI001CC36E91|nr:UPF0280 family protein [Aureimonas sp. SA4125]BDA86522.1 hypothetical protein Sa4125_40640 [Aureimonas sp. SA4125]
MRRGPQVALLADGRRLHLQDGPIDLIVEAFGSPGAVTAAYEAAIRRLDGLLEALCQELSLLRAPVTPGSARPLDPVGLRMHAAVAPYAAEAFVTPMAAVAGAVADAVLASMVAAAPLDRAYVNNGGDIAVHLGQGQRLAAGLVGRSDRPFLFGRCEIAEGDPVRGVATSGRGGRSFSLGIADAVTILARTAAEADAAATIVANAVDLPGHAAITRVAAADLQPDSDLGHRLVTRGVGPLAPDEIDLALRRGLHRAERLVGAGLIEAAALHLAGQTLVTGRHAIIAA